MGFLQRLLPKLKSAWAWELDTGRVTTRTIILRLSVPTATFLIIPMPAHRMVTTGRSGSKAEYLLAPDLGSTAGTTDTGVAGSTITTGEGATGEGAIGIIEVGETEIGEAAEAGTAAIEDSRNEDSAVADILRVRAADLAVATRDFAAMPALAVTVASMVEVVFMEAEAFTVEEDSTAVAALVEAGSMVAADMADTAEVATSQT